MSHNYLTIIISGLLFTSSPLIAQVLMPQYSIWEGFAFGNQHIVESREAEERFARFLLKLERQNPTQQANQISELLITAEQHNATARFLALADKYLYDPNSPYRNEERYLLFLQYAADHSLQAFINNSRYQKHFIQVQKNRVGHKATNFQYITQSGEKGNLYDLQSKYTLLFFHDPGCEECQYIKKQMELNQTFFIQKGVRILAVYIDEDVALWQATYYPSEWLSVYANEIESQDLYHIRALPTLYLLDSNKKVLLKDVPFELLSSSID